MGVSGSALRLGPAALSDLLAADAVGLWGLTYAGAPLKVSEVFLEEAPGCGREDLHAVVDYELLRHVLVDQLVALDEETTVLGDVGLHQVVLLIVSVYSNHGVAEAVLWDFHVGHREGSEPFVVSDAEEYDHVVPVVLVGVEEQVEVTVVVDRRGKIRLVTHAADQVDVY